MQTGCARLGFIEQKTEETNILPRDGKETRLGWGEAHNVHKACIGFTEGFKANMCTWLHNTSPILSYTCRICSLYIVMVYSETSQQ